MMAVQSSAVTMRFPAQITKKVSGYTYLRSLRMPMGVIYIRKLCDVSILH